MPTVTIAHRDNRPRSPREVPISIYLNDVKVAVSQGSPFDVEELAVGYLLSEGLLSDRDKFVDATANDDNTAAYVFSQESVDPGSEILKRVTSSGCAQSALLTNAGAMPSPVQSFTRFDPTALLSMMAQLLTESPHRNTGQGMHGCGIGAEGRLACAREDIGRHNAMDKLIGQAWIDRLPIEDMAMFTTGRITYEMALKAARAGVGIVVSHKGVTDSAADIAETLNVTTVAYCRDDSMTVLTHPGRIIV